MYLVIANWKLTQSRSSVLDWLTTFRENYRVKSSVRVGIAPSFTELSLVADFLANWNMADQVDLVAQDVSRFPKGNYTGEVAAYQLKEYQVRYCVVGHSERRRYFHETSEQVLDKCNELMEQGITPIIAVSQLSELEGLKSSVDINRLNDKLVIVYEPITAIGTGNPADVDSVREFFTKTNSWVDSSQRVQYMYGGSVDSETVRQYLHDEILNGFLVGTASYQADHFLKIIESIDNEVQRSK
jgi:triosephosphate isomerase